MSKFNPTKYKNDFVKENYDRLNIQVPKGQKAIIEEHWKEEGYKSLNSYVNALIMADMARKEGKGKTVNIGRDNKGTINM